MNPSQDTLQIQVHFTLTAVSKTNSRFVNGRTCDKGNDDFGMSNLQAHSLWDVLILLSPKLRLGEDELGLRKHVSFELWCWWCRTWKIQHDTQW